MPLNAMKLEASPAGTPASSLVDELRSLGGVEPQFQPILELEPRGRRHRRVRGLECLTRGPRGSRFESAGALFDESRSRGESLEVDRYCLAKALRAVGPVPEGVDLFLNVHAATLEVDPDLVTFLERRAAWAGLTPARLVVEVVEAQPMVNASAFQVALHRLRASGVRIALDDIGQGHSTNRMILAVRPDYIKLDRFLVRGVYFDVHRRALVASYAYMARELGIRTVAEGVESRTQLATLEELGVDLCQGFLFARPLPMGALRRAGLLASGAIELPGTSAESC